MHSRQYAVVAAVVFTIVAVVQALRLFYGWHVVVGSAENSDGGKLGSRFRRRALGHCWLYDSALVADAYVNCDRNTALM